MVCITNRLVNQLNWPIADIEKMWPISRFVIIDRVNGATLFIITGSLQALTKEIKSGNVHRSMKSFQTNISASALFGARRFLFSS